MSGDFFQIRDAVEPGSDPIARSQHVARDGGLHGVHVINEARRREDAYQEDEAACENDNPTVPPAVPG